MKKITLIVPEHKDFASESNSKVYMYPENNKTPKEQLEFVKQLKLLTEINHLTIVSCSVYIIEAVVKWCSTKETEFEYSDGKNKLKDLNELFKCFSEPMIELALS